MSGTPSFGRLLSAYRSLSGKPYESARFVTVDLPVRAENVRPLLPVGMWLPSQPSATLFAANYRPTFTHPYQEAGVLLRVITPFGKGVYCPWIVLNNDTALLYGRCFTAFPKKWAEILWEENAEVTRVRVCRRGAQVLSLEMTSGATASDPKPLWGQKIFNVGGMGEMHAVNLVWMMKVKEQVRDVRRSRLNIALHSTPSDPLGSWLLSEPVVEGYTLSSELGSIRYLVPVGLTGPIWFLRNFALRFH
jgi:acetoacetate decarboxylase